MPVTIKAMGDIGTGYIWMAIARVMNGRSLASGLGECLALTFNGLHSFQDTLQPDRHLGFSSTPARLRMVTGISH